MNWRSIKHLTEDDHGRVLLIKSNNSDCPAYFLGVASRRQCFLPMVITKYLDPFCSSWSVRQIPNAQFVRIDEIKD